jgi:DNA polymerase-3 subunit delta'
MKFSEVIGQDEVKKQLLKTVKNSRVSHAQLFLGQGGSGKLSLAIAYAQYINCTNKQENDSCGTCPSCIKYEKLIHPDLHFIYPTATTEKLDKPKSKDFVSEWRELVLANNGYIQLSDWYGKIGIERKQAIINTRDCNDIIQTLGYKSFEAEYKVMIIWMVEKLFHAAAPRLLKILEEPPDKTLFILVAENQESILKTILSRAQLIKIPSIHDEDLSVALRSKGHESAIVNDVVRVCRGSYLEARTLIGNLEVASANHKWFIEWMRVCWKGEVSLIMTFISGFVRNSRDVQKNMLVYTLRMMREAFLVNLNNRKLTKLNSSEEDFVQNFNKFVNARNIELINEELNNSIYHIERNVNSNVLFLDMSLKFNRFLKM